MVDGARDHAIGVVDRGVKRRRWVEEAKAIVNQRGHHPAVEVESGVGHVF